MTGDATLNLYLVKWFERGGKRAGVVSAIPAESTEAAARGLVAKKGATVVKAIEYIAFVRTI